MFNQREKPKYKTLIEGELESTIRALKSHTVVSEEYTKTLSAAERLHEMIKEEKSSVSKDALLTVGANLLGILMIINHEYAHPITSKALSFIIRPRVI